MVFNSFSYLYFFLSVVLVYFATPLRFRWIVVLVSSYGFYISSGAAYTFLFFGTTVVNWLLVLWMANALSGAQKKAILILNIGIDLSILVFFKYFNFASMSLWGAFNIQGEPFLVNVVLPIGISFYTFQSLAYIIDVYRGALAPEKNLGRYAAFVAFFPHLVSGPILKPSSIIPPLH